MWPSALQRTTSSPFWAYETNGRSPIAGIVVVRVDHSRRLLTVGTPLPAVLEDDTYEARPDHRNHRPGRPLPRGAAALQGLRGLRPDPRAEQPEAAPWCEATVPDVKLLTGDLTDLSSLLRAMESAQPDEVYNLGAISFVAYSWENAHLTTDVTGKGVLNMLEAVRLYSHDDPTQGPLLPGVQLGDVRQGAGGPAAREHPALAALAVRRRQGLRPLHDDQLPRVVRHARQLGDPVQPRVAAPRARSS